MLGPSAAEEVLALLGRAAGVLSTLLPSPACRRDIRLGSLYPEPMRAATSGRRGPIWSGAQRRFSSCCSGQGRYCWLTRRPSAPAASGAAGTTKGSGSACSRPAARSTASMRWDTCRPEPTLSRVTCSCWLAATMPCHTWAALHECSCQQSQVECSFQQSRSNRSKWQAV